MFSKLSTMFLCLIIVLYSHIFVILYAILDTPLALPLFLSFLPFLFSSILLLFLPSPPFSFFFHFLYLNDVGVDMGICCRFCSGSAMPRRPLVLRPQLMGNYCVPVLYIIIGLFNIAAKGWIKQYAN